jgi:hypothetical protein
MKNCNKQVIFIVAFLLANFPPSLHSAENSAIIKSASISATAMVISPIGIVTQSDEISTELFSGTKFPNILEYHRQKFRSLILYSGQQENNLLMTVEIDGQPIQTKSDLINSVDLLILNNKAVGRSVLSLEKIADWWPIKGSEYLITLVTTDN